MLSCPCVSVEYLRTRLDNVIRGLAEKNILVLLDMHRVYEGGPDASTAIFPMVGAPPAYTQAARWLQGVCVQRIVIFSSRNWWLADSASPFGLKTKPPYPFASR